MHFDWDEEKNQTNISKHGLDFADASRIFEAPMFITLDTRENYDEDRYIGIGFLDARVVVVVFTETEPDTIRIISLRKAQGYERTRLEELIKDGLGAG